MKRKKDDLSEKEIMRTLDTLYTAAGSLQGRDAVKLFLRDLLTESERIMLGRRVLIARMLLEGMNRRQIMEKLHVGPDTVQRVQHWLNDQFPGFEKAVDGLKKEFGNRFRETEQRKVLAELKRKYPLHFLLWPAGKKKSSKSK